MPTESKFVLWSCIRTFINLSELHKLLDLLVVEGVVLSVVLTDEVLLGRSYKDKTVNQLKYSSMWNKLQRILLSFLMPLNKYMMKISK